MLSVANHVTGPASATDGQMALFSGTTGKLLRAALNTGLVTVSSGVASTVAAPVGAVVGTSDAQSLSGKTMVDQVCSYQGLTYRPSGVILINATQTANPGATEQSFLTFTLPAGFMARDGDTVRVSSAFAGVNDTTSKSVTVRFGGEIVFTHTSVSNNVLWSTICTITRVSVSSQRYTSHFNYEDTVSVFLGRCSTAPGTVNLAGTVLIAINGAGTAASKIFHNRTMIEFLPAP